MRVVGSGSALGYTARDRGVIRKDGTITGTLTDSNGSRGRWTMTRGSASKSSSISTNTTALIVGLVVLLLMLVVVILLVRWIVRRVARLFRKRRASGLGSDYEQMITQGPRRAQAESKPSQHRPLPFPPPQHPASREPERKTCPDCAESVLAAARVCRYCGYRFDTSPDPETPAPAP